MPQSKSSKRWLGEHFEDPYVKRAQQEGYRGRAAYKLLEIQEKDSLLKLGMRVVDLGAAPGSWSQVASRLVGRKGEIFALDILPMDPIPGVTVIQGDFTKDAVLSNLIQLLQGHPVDLVMSDMAPNFSGMPAIDQPRAMLLAELALDFARQVLKQGGVFLVKTFQGTDFESYFKALRADFETVKSRKPKASRSRSREVFLLAKGYKHVYNE